MKKSWWDKTKPFVELGGILLLALYTGFTVAMYFANRDAANAAKSSASAAHDALVASNRPWIDLVVSLQSELTYDESGASIYLGTVKKKVGHSPAIRVVRLSNSFSNLRIHGQNSVVYAIKLRRSLHCRRINSLRNHFSRCAYPRTLPVHASQIRSL